MTSLRGRCLTYGLLSESSGLDKAHPPQTVAHTASAAAAPSISATPVVAPSVSAPPNVTSAVPYVAAPHVAAPDVATPPASFPSISSAMENLNLEQNACAGFEHLAAGAADDAHPCPQPKARRGKAKRTVTDSAPAETRRSGRKR